MPQAVNATTSHAGSSTSRRFTEHLWSPAQLPAPADADVLVGVLPGEGIGPEIVQCALETLQAVASVLNFTTRIEFGGAIGRDSEQLHGTALSTEVTRFCRDLILRGGSVLSGAGGGRFVYDLRSEFDLFCKISPIRPVSPPPIGGGIHPSHADGLDLLVVREGRSGVYHGQSESHAPGAESHRETHSFSYSATEVTRILEVASRIALERSGRLSVIYKESGVPGISNLWRTQARRIAAQHDLQLECLDIDYACYRLLQTPRSFDVIVAPNLFGDILSDLGGFLLGSRGLTFGGNFGPGGAAFYQTNHGAAYDLAGTDRANPLGQILSMAMLLRQSFGRHAAADGIESAIRRVRSEGWGTSDLHPPAGRLVGTRELTSKVIDAIRAGA